MTRDDKVEKIKQLLRARMTGDFSQLGAVVQPDAPFAFNGVDTLINSFPKSRDGSVQDAAETLFAKLTLHEYAFDDFVSEGDSLAIKWRGTFSLTGNATFEAQLFTLWRFGDDGKVSSGIDFFDTALLLAKMQEAGM